MLLHRLTGWKDIPWEGGTGCFRVVTLRVPGGLHTLICTTAPSRVTLNQFRNLDLNLVVSGPQAVGEESQL